MLSLYCPDENMEIVGAGAVSYNVYTLNVTQIAAKREVNRWLTVNN